MPFLGHLAGGLEDGARLHLGDLGIGDAETAAAMAEHRVELVQLLDAAPAASSSPSERLALLLPSTSMTAISTIRSSRLGRNSCSGGSSVRIITGKPSIALNTPYEVLALHRQQLVQRLAAILLVVGENHALHDRDAAFAEEHVLGAAQADAVGAERVGQLGLVRMIGVGAHAEAAELVGPSSTVLNR